MAELRIPELGEGIEHGTVVALRAAAGSRVTCDQIVIEVETDKVTLEIPAPGDGVIEAWSVTVGEIVRPAQIVAAFVPDTLANPPSAQRATGVSGEPAPAFAAPIGREIASARVPPVASRGVATDLIAAGPGTRREARELGVDLAALAASHPGRRLTREVVRRFVRTRCALREDAQALPDISAHGPTHTLTQTAIERATARNVARSAAVIPHAWVATEASLGVLDPARQRWRAESASPPLTLSALLCKALALALAEFPRFNSIYAAQEHMLIVREYINIGVALDTPRGLLVPVLRDAGRRALDDLARELSGLTARARGGEAIALTPYAAGMTLTNLGALGVTGLTPLVNWPEVAILGVGATRGAGAGRVLPLNLGFDHRVIQGADAARFLAFLCALLSEPERLRETG